MRSENTKKIMTDRPRKDLRSAERAAKAKTVFSETEYRSVLENMPSGVAYHRIITDKNDKPVDYVFLGINKAFEKLVGLERGKIIGKMVTEVMPGIRSSMFDWINFYSAVASSGKEVEFEQYLHDLDRWFLVSAYSPKAGYFITIYDDITKRKKIEESLRQAYGTLKKTQASLIQTGKMELVGKLASGVAHEVKNPLAIVMQGIDYLVHKTKRSGKDIKAALKAMNDAVKRASMIINDLLNFSRLPNMQMVQEDVNAVIESALLMIKNEIGRCRIDVIKDLGKNIPKTALDKNRIAQVLINLFMNAIHAMPEGGRLKISTRYRRKKDQNAVIVRIDDSGTGIQEEIIDKIFDPFFTTKESSSGTGLGLFIVKMIIEGHNGSVKIENRKDQKGVRATLVFKVL